MATVAVVCERIVMFLSVARTHTLALFPACHPHMSTAIPEGALHFVVDISDVGSDALVRLSYTLALYLHARSLDAIMFLCVQ